eukprot:1174738-Pleurochrysis_carterae.AAC.1
MHLLYRSEDRVLLKLRARAPSRSSARVQDAEGFASACAQGRALGFDGKTLIHPSTLAAANA